MAMSADPGSHEDEPPNTGRTEARSEESRLPSERGEKPRPDTGHEPGQQAEPTQPTEREGAGEPEVDTAGDERAILAEALDKPEVLPCGHLLDELWERWADAPAAAQRDPHLSTCAHCGTALDELRRLDRYVRQEVERDEQEAARTPLADTGRITERVMEIVRTELRPGASVPLGERDEDHWITETAAARTLRAAAEEENGVQAGSCRISPADGPEPRLALPGSRLPRAPLRVRIGIVAPLRPHTPVPETAGRVRERVATAARDELGMEVAAVDVVVVDVTEPTSPDDPDTPGGHDDGAQEGTP